MSKRKLLELGVIGIVPIDTLFQLYLETNSGDCLTFYQTRCSASIGGWVYEAAACLAKYLETSHFRMRMTGSDASAASTTDACAESPPSPEALSTHPLKDKTVVELGAGTGIVGILASYYGSKSIITDFESLVPLIQFNIDRNQELIRGSAVAEPLCWGAEIPSTVAIPNYLVLANCVYYESSLEPLLETMLELTNQETVVLACYEERTREIKGLVGRWHTLLDRYFDREEVEKRFLQNTYWREYVRVVIMRRKKLAEVA